MNLEEICPLCGVVFGKHAQTLPGETRPGCPDTDYILDADVLTED